MRGVRGAGCGVRGAWLREGRRRAESCGAERGAIGGIESVNRAVHGAHDRNPCLVREGLMEVIGIGARGWAQGPAAKNMQGKHARRAFGSHTDLRVKFG